MTKELYSIQCSDQQLDEVYKILKSVEADIKKKQKINFTTNFIFESDTPWTNMRAKFEDMKIIVAIRNRETYEAKDNK